MLTPMHDALRVDQVLMVNRFGFLLLLLASGPMHLSFYFLLKKKLCTRYIHLNEHCPVKMRIECSEFIVEHQT